MSSNSGKALNINYKTAISNSCKILFCLMITIRLKNNSIEKDE